MNEEWNRNGRSDASDPIAGAVAERRERGHASEARFGFAATVANATPPIDETFRRRLRGRIVAEAAQPVDQEGQARAAPGRKRIIRPWSLALAGGLAAVLVLVLGVAALQQTGLWSRLPSFRPGWKPETASPVQLARSDVDALVDRLNAETAARTVAVFPGDYASALAEHIAHRVVPVALGDDPSPATARAAVGAAVPDNGLVDVVLVDQNGRQEVHAVQAALEQELYRIYRSSGDASAETLGTLQRIEYVVGPQDATLQPVGATFNNGVELAAAGVLDTPRAGKLLPVALEWRAERPVDEPLTVFTHVFCEGRLLAQRDAVPGNGQFPATGWEPGEVVRDQFALQLPEDLPAGQCQVQVGIYNPETGRRYRPVDSEGAPYIVIYEFPVQGADQAL